MKKTLLGALALGASAIVLTDAPRAEACGGCFVPQTESTVVTDHRMALSISTQQTVLWDQIRYNGDPREFAWVLPVRAGAKLELANDEFFTALDSSTQPVVVQPNTFAGAAGCALTGCASDSSEASGAAPGEGEVQVLSQSVVGPYETVTLRATDDDALTKWLVRNSFSIPPSIAPTISAYVSEGFDFIALRLRPQCSERSMQPVRVVTPGADPTLPLRMVAAGVGPRVGITLWVITEGRYQPQNFPHGIIEEADIRWDRFQGRSNYQSLSETLMSQANGRTWLTEYANNPQLPPVIGKWTPSSASQVNRFNGVFTPGLTDAYFRQCKAYAGQFPSNPSTSPTTSPTNQQPPLKPCPQATDAGNQNQDQDAQAQDAGTDAQTGDGGNTDAGVNDAGPVSDAGTDGGEKIDAGGEPIDPEEDSGTSKPPSNGDPCAYLDDLDVALSGLHRENIWVTRLRSILPADALSSGDLRLEAAKEQKIYSHVHYARYFTDEDSLSQGTTTREGCGSAPKEHRAYGSWVVAGLTAIFGIAAVRRRRRR